jgi:divalent metal cation (Fe/Co/Zn/Cd) transporter
MAAIGMIVIGSIILYPSYESIMRPREIQHQILTMIVLAAAGGISLHRGFQMRIIANKYDILSLKTDTMNSTKDSSASVIGFFSVLISSQLGVIHADATLYKRKEGEEHVTNSIFKKVESALLMKI